MSDSNSTRLNRRRFLVTGATVLGGLAAAPALAQSTFVDSTANDPLASRNISSFHSQTWQPYFSSLKGGAILVDTTSRALHFWSADGTIYRLYPTSVPLSEDMTRRGRTTVVNKVEGPSWSPTPSGRTSCRRGRTTRSGPMRSISAGSTTASTAPTTRARSGGVRRADASGSTTSTSPNFTRWSSRAAKCC